MEFIDQINLSNYVTILGSDMANPMLLWFVGYSNMTSIVIVTLCFLAMTVFIGFISMNGDNQSRSNIHIGIEQKNMVKLSNPFFIQLEQHSKKLTDGLHLRLSSLLPSKIFVIWGGKINPFHDLILKPGRWIQKAFVSNQIEKNRDLDILHCDKLQFLEAGNHSINLPCPDCVSSETLGDIPRKRYPVAVFIFVLNDSSLSANATCQDEENTDSADTMWESESQSDNVHSIIGLISIIHLQDEKVTQSSHIINQYVKTSGVPLYSLQPLYLSRDSSRNQQSNGSVTTMGQDRNNKGNSPVPPVKLIKSNNENIEDISSGAHSISELRRSCSSCDSLLAGNRESVLKQLKTHNSDLHKAVEDICDKCSGINSEVKTDEQCNSKQLNKQVKGIENEVKVATNLSSELSDVNNYKDEECCQTNSQAECVVCQAHQVRCALLPCRHACVCVGCLKLLFRCPMCRAGIESYFLLRNNLTVLDGNTDNEDVEDVDDGEEEALQSLQHQAVNASFNQMWHRFNTRLNNILGYR